MKESRAKSSILIRTSGGIAPRKQLGFGHIYRSANLARSLKPNQIRFLVEDFGNAGKVLNSMGFTNLEMLQKDVPLNIDIAKTITLIKKYKVDVLIIDRYQLKKKYVQTVSKFTKIAVISDLWLIDFPADLIFNGFIGFSNRKIKNRYGKICYVGPKYQIINPNFSHIKKIKKTVDVLATFGGFDENKIVEMLLETAQKYKKLKLKIILGPGTAKSSKILQFKKILGKNLILKQKTNNMKQEILQSRYGLCSGGITTYEFAACNVPFAIISQVQHQTLTSKEWRKRQIAMDLGLVRNKTKKKLEHFLESIETKKIRTKKMRVVDGKASESVSKIILNLLT